MGQGCSSDLGVFVATKRRADRYAESPDLVMREIAQTSVSTIRNLRRHAHAEHFGSRSHTVALDDTPGQSIVTRPNGQDHLLFHNLQKAANSSSNCHSLREITNSDHKSHKLRGGRGRKIAESFETDRNGRIFRSVTTEEIPTTSNHSQPRKDSNNNSTISKHNISEAAREAFQVALSEEIARICPTRLWIRRSFPKKRNKMLPRAKKPPPSTLQKEQRPPDQTISEPRQVVLLEEGKCYQRKHDYFGLGAAQEPVPYTPTQASTHIYAVRYSPDGCKQFVMPKDVSQSATTSTKESYWIPITNDEASVNDMFSQANMALPPERDVVSWTTISEEHNIYVVDLGLTPKECDEVVTTTEQECKGRYAAYTYAKQTLGCKEYPLLARAALGPVHSVVGAILTKFDGKGPDAKEKHTKEKQTAASSQSPIDDVADSASGDRVNENNNISGEDVPYDEEEIQSSSMETAPSSPPKQQILQLDDREPHIVKYDLTRKERQKLEMHTDKSEWTFLIALSNGCGMDYDGGGTFFECLDATVHIQKGHALVFPGRLRHKGQAIHHGLRFLLVGFLVDKSERGRSSEPKDTAALATSADSSPKNAAVCTSTGTIIQTSTVVPPSQVVAA